MPLIRFPTVKGLVYTIDLSKIADRANPRTVEAPISSAPVDGVIIDWGDGSAPQSVSSGSFPAHTYAEGTGDVFTVTLRSATGRIPDIAFSDSNNEQITYNLTLAVTSIDHFGGWIGAQTSRVFRYVLMNTLNLEYFDTRIFGQYTWTNLQRSFNKCGSRQPFRSLCFDFLNELGYMYAAFQDSALTGALPDRMLANKVITTLTDAFRNCKGLTSVPDNFLDNTTTITSLNGTFRLSDNTAFTEPFVFWKEDGSIDTDKYPSLNNTSNCYSGCNATLRAKVPEAHGGTMTVS